METIEPTTTLCVEIKKKKYIRPKCPHNRYKFDCRDCGGNRFCIHNNDKARCKECGGSQICIHNKDKRNCKECGGSIFCIHNKDKRYCKECGGSAICIHNKSKYICKECDGIGICIHNKYKAYCKECDGSAYCIHDKLKCSCKECGGSKLCIHNKHKAYCKECDGSAYCIHDKIKPRCKECGGASYCIHDKRKDYCKECDGSAYCIHKKRKEFCKECGGSKLCKTEKCEIIVRKNYKGYCIRCYINLFPDEPNCRNYKTKEKHVVDYITENIPEYTFINDKKIIDGCSKRRPDMLLDLGSHILIIEIDENKHTSYTTECEIARLNDLSNDVGFRPIVMVRFNTDGYMTTDGIKIQSCWKLDKQTNILVINQKKIQEWNTRLQKLVETINYYIHDIPTEIITIKELYY